MNELLGVIKEPLALESKTIQTLRALKVDTGVFAEPQAAVDLLSKCIFDPGSSQSLAPVSDASLAALKKQVLRKPELCEQYDNSELTPIATYASGMLKLLTERAGYKVLGQSLVDQNGIYNSNNVGLLDSQINGRLVGNRTLRLGQRFLRETFPNTELLRSGGDEFILLTDEENLSPLELQERLKRKQLEILDPKKNSPYYSFFYEKRVAAIKPLGFASEPLSESHLESRPYLRTETVSLENLQQRVAYLNKSQPGLRDFLNKLQFEPEYLDSLNVVLEILENTYLDPLLLKESQDLERSLQEAHPGLGCSITCFGSPEGFVNRLKEKQPNHVLMMFSVPNGLRLANRISHAYGDEKLKEMFTLIAKESGITKLDFFRRGPDFYLAVDPQEAPKVAINLQAKLDTFAQQMFEGKQIEGDKFKIPFSVIQVTELNLSEKGREMNSFGEAMSSLSEQGFQIIKERQQELLTSQDLRPEFQNYLFEYYNLLDKRGYIRAFQILRSSSKDPAILENLAQEYQIYCFFSPQSKQREEAKLRILKLIRNTLQ